MLNYNSPVVQAMLQNTPEGHGNFPSPGYFGSQPTVTTETVQSNPDNKPSMPFPDPKEMLMQQGQNMVYYSPTNFAPVQNQNIVGGLTNNPGYQAAFSGYSNPFMGYGSYGGFNPSGTYYGQNPAMYYPMDDDAKERMELATINGLTYDQQLQNESSVYKAMSRVVSKVIGRSEEEAKKCEEAFDLYNKYPRPEEFRKKKKDLKFHIVIKNENGEVIADNATCPRPIFDPETCAKNGSYYEEMRKREEIRKEYVAKMQSQMYAQATERKFDNVELIDFFNNCSGVIASEAQMRTLQMQNAQRIAQAYNKDSFRKKLLVGDVKDLPPSRVMGSYGIMPDGRPVQPWHDPSVAESFSYEPSTGKYYVTAPNFIQNRLDKAREAFIKSIE